MSKRCRFNNSKRCYHSSARASEYDKACRELIESEKAEEELFERELREAGIKPCRYDGLPCEGGLVDDSGVSHCCVWNRSGEGIVCLRVRLKGGVGYGMSLFEKLKRQGLLDNDCKGR